jgi:hypothetical protein
MTPEHFIEYKVTRVFMNDQPPAIYIAVVLWVKVLINLLSDEQKEALRVGGPNKRLPLDLNVDAVQRFINDEMLRGGHVRRHWVRSGLEFLRSCGLAEVKEDGTVRVQYWNVPASSREFASEAERAMDEVREYGQRLARMHCKGPPQEPQEEEPAPGTERKERQSRLLDYGAPGPGR